MINATIQEIQAAVGESFGVTRDDLIGRDRTAAMAAPRHVAMLLCRCYTSKSTVVIGREFGRRDHTTVISNARRARTLFVENAAIRKKTLVIIAGLAP